MYSAGIITYIIKNKEPLYLLLHYTAGHWEFPKGTMEPGENKQETANRELYEETGLTASIDDDFEESIQYFFVTHDKQKVLKTVYFFTGKANTDVVTLSHEHVDFIWLPYKEALNQLTYDRSKPLLKKAHKHIIFIQESTV